MDLAPVTSVELTPGYAALRERAAWLDLSGRGKIFVTGEDRARLLHALATNHIEQLRPGQGCYAFFLNAQGRILGDVNVLCFEDRFLLDTEPETRQKIFEHLDRYIIADDVTIQDATDTTATLAIEGPESAAALIRAGAWPPETPYSWTEWESRIVARINSTGSSGFFIFTPAAEKGAVAGRLGVPAATPEAARVVRIEHGRPRYGDEITERYLVQETGQLHAVHFNKGCYLGQEIVERVRSRGQVHRFLRQIEIDAQELPEAGLKTEAGEIVSAAFSLALGKTVALAYLRAPFAEPGTEIAIGAAHARVI